MTLTRNNHYVPQWHQRGFLLPDHDKLNYLDLNPDEIFLPNGDPVLLPDGQIKKHIGLRTLSPKKCFYQKDLYSTFFIGFINDDVEKYLFGDIDTKGAKAVTAYINGDAAEMHHSFQMFFEYMDMQKLRTPKGLSWLNDHYQNLNQTQLMIEMQSVRNMNCTMWTEGVREIVSAKNSEVKFITTDHPITVFNKACPPSSTICQFPNDPRVAQLGSQTIYPLNQNHCMILTNYEYAQNPHGLNPLKNRTNARNFGNSLVRTDAFIRSRDLDADEVMRINLILKSRATRYIAAAREEWLYPEKQINYDWSAIGDVLLPPKNELFGFGGEMYVGYEDGSTHYQDAFGRTSKDPDYLKKTVKDVGRNDYCGCGSGKKFKKCCYGKDAADRSTWEVLSIRERNLEFCNAVKGILGLDQGKTWDDVRRDLSSKQVKLIHQAYNCMWPIDTRLEPLLPKPDEKVSRAVYSGLIDPRAICQYATGLTPYFDELIIINPFINPESVNKDFRPTENPSQYRLDTLKNVLLLLTLEPFIDMGFINLIPDPFTFNPDLRKQLMDMARNRVSGDIIVDAARDQYEYLHKVDFERGLYGLPRESQKKMYLRTSPEISEEDIESVLDLMKERRQKDPLALLNDTALTEEGGQMTMFHLTPNHECSLFLCQLTGAIFVTDSKARLLELESASRDLDCTQWQEVSTFFENLEFPINSSPNHCFGINFAKKHVDAKTAIHAISIAVQAKKNETIPVLKQKLKKASEKCFTEIQGPLGIQGHDLGEPSEFSRQCKFKCIIPNDGFQINNVQRILLSYGSVRHTRTVPMAIFVEAP